MRDTDFIARFGGEEFVVLLPNINPDKYQKPLENLRQTIKSIPFRFRDARVEITISIGATLFRTGDHTTDAFERADKALYSSSTPAGIRSISPESALRAAKKRQTHSPLFPCPPLASTIEPEGCQSIPFSPRKAQR